MEDFDEALPIAREAVTEVSRVYDRVEAVRPKVNGSTFMSENTEREQPLGAVPRWLEPRLLQTVSDAALKENDGERYSNKQHKIIRWF